MSAQLPSILIVDDDEYSREMLSRRLQRQPYAITTAADATEALEHLGSQRFDLILLDIMMPHIGGIDLLKRVRQIYSTTDLPIIMVTALDESGSMVEALNNGANDYITKPLDFPVVLARVQTQLAVKHSVDRIWQLERNFQLQNEDLAQTNRWLEGLNADLAEANRRMKADLRMAAQVQHTLLPSALPELPRARFASRHQACSDLAGDLLNVVPLDERYVGLYVLDVVGHGAAAALLAVMVTRVLARLQPAYIPKPASAQPVAPTPILPPSVVARELAREFPWNPVTEQYFTILYGVLDLEKLELCFISAGHPLPLVVSRGGAVRTLPAEGKPIGWEEEDYLESTAALQPGDRLLLYTDGLTKARNPQRDFFGEERVQQLLQRNRGRPLLDQVGALWRGIEDWCGPSGIRDDVTILLCEVGEAVIGTVPSPFNSTAVAPLDETLAIEPIPDSGPQPPANAPALVPLSHTRPVLASWVGSVVPDDATRARDVSAAAGPALVPALLASRPPAAAITLANTYSFLAPARGPDEMGWLGPYRILKELGTGGMAFVFHAEDSQLLRRVALKVMKPDLAANETFRQRFLREARAAAAIDNDHIIGIYQVSQDHGIPFMAMQLLQGESLEGRLRREGKLPAGEVVRIGREIGEGLAAAHAQNLIHRDIKPDNIWLETRPAPAPPRVKILDFGLVRLIGPSPELTKTGLIMGTPSYMSPEQARGHILDVRSDLFSLGTVLYRMCTGVLPFTGCDTLAILAALALDDPPTPTAMNPEVPPSLAELIGRLLAKDREGRPDSAQRVIMALQEVERDLIPVE